MPPHLMVRPMLGWRGPLVEFISWPEIPASDLGRQEGGSASLAAALWVWQIQDFSSALCSVKPKMCLARNPSLIFKPLSNFYINLIHMFLSYFYLAHQIELGATMMKGTMLISKKILEPFFLRTKSHFLPNC